MQQTSCNSGQWQMKGILWWLQLTALRDSRPGCHEGQPGRAPRGRGSQAGPVGIADLRRQLKDQGGRSSKDTEKRELHRGKSGYMNTRRHSAENWSQQQRKNYPGPGKNLHNPSNFREVILLSEICFLICKLRSSAQTCIDWSWEFSPLNFFFKKKIPESHFHYAWDAVMGISTIKSTLTTTTPLPRPS